MRISYAKRLVTLTCLLMMLLSAVPSSSYAYPYWGADSRSGCSLVKGLYRQCMSVWVTWKLTGPGDYQVVSPTRVKGSMHWDSDPFLKYLAGWTERYMHMYLYVYSDYGRQSAQWREYLGYATPVDLYDPNKNPVTYDSRLPSYNWYWNRAGHDLAVFYAADSVFNPDNRYELLWNLSISLP